MPNQISNIRIGGKVQLPSQGNQSPSQGPIIPPVATPVIGPQRRPGGQGGGQPYDWGGQVDAWRGQGRPNKLANWI
jgi:hypothetical protein